MGWAGTLGLVPTDAARSCEAAGAAVKRALHAGTRGDSSHGLIAFVRQQPGIMEKLDGGITASEEATSAFLMHSYKVRHGRRG